MMMMNFTRRLSRKLLSTTTSTPTCHRSFAAITRSKDGIPQDVCILNSSDSGITASSLGPEEVHLSFVSSIIGTSDMNIISTGGKS